MTKKKDEAAATDAAQETSTAIAVQGESDILALSGDGGGDLTQIIEENFGGSALTLADLDKIKLPGSGGKMWEVPSLMDDDSTREELKGVIIGWADKKSWWVKSFAESGGKEQPDCRSNDMVHGVGNPNAFYNDKEEALMAGGKIGLPVRGSGGFLCSTCPHNQFGSAPNGGGKSCQDKRFLVILLEDSIIPVLLRAPATSITPLKAYFKRLAGARKSYLSVVTALTLIKVDAKIAYSQIVAKAVRSLTPEEEKLVRSLRAPFQAALEAEDAVDAGHVEKTKAEETLNDMPSAAAPTPVEPAQPDAFDNSKAASKPGDEPEF